MVRRFYARISVGRVPGVAGGRAKSGLGATHPAGAAASSWSEWVKINSEFN